MTRRSLSFTFIGIALLGTTGYLFWDGVDRRPLDRLHPDAHPRVDRDLKAILADTLRVLVLQDPLTWEPVRSGARGLEWELLQGYAADRGIPVRAVRVPVADSLLSWLQQGRGDVVAA
ncbi:MAG: hypothetical protein KDB88_02900, partial [Flavobacteriales bacterium]|nr:hypothetical protein [Flavobacteriales bacterium]